MRRVLVVAAVLVSPVVVGALVLVLLAATGTVKSYAIASPTMQPALRCGRPQQGCDGSHDDRVLVLTRFVGYARGDIVVFEAPRRAVRACGVAGRFVKRIVGLPGERVEVRTLDGAAHVFVDGRRLEEPYVRPEYRDPGPQRSWRVPGGSYFVLGDNRSQSCDSRVWGFVPSAALAGEVALVYWPPDRIGFR